MTNIALPGESPGQGTRHNTGLTAALASEASAQRGNSF